MRKWTQLLTFSNSDLILRLIVKLYGTLGRSFDAYDHLSGLEVSVPEGATIDDLLLHLNLAPERLGIISMDGKALKKKARLRDGAQIKIFQPIAGG